MKKEIRDFRDLEVYQLTLELTEDVYEITSRLPLKEKFNIIDQLNRAICSVGANIAEGFGRFHSKELVKFLYNSRGSLMEVFHFLILANKLKYFDDKKLTYFEDKIKVLNIKINNLIRAIIIKNESRNK